MYWADGMQHGLLKSHTTVVAKSVVPRIPRTSARESGMHMCTNMSS